MHEMHSIHAMHEVRNKPRIILNVLVFQNQHKIFSGGIIVQGQQMALMDAS